MRANPEGTNGLGWIPQGARGRWQRRGRGEEGREGSGCWANQGAAASGCRAPAPRAPVLTEDKVVVVVFFSWTGSYLGSCVCEVVTALC